MNPAGRRRGCRLTIAGVRFDMDAPKGIRLDPFPAEYSDFVKMHDRNTAVSDVRVRIRIGALSKNSKAPLIFESGQAWAMFAPDAGRQIVFQPPGATQPLWVASWGPEMKAVTVCCAADTLVANRLPNPVRYPLDQLLLLYVLSMRRGMLVHAAGAVFQDRAYLFPGRSGAGKSSVAALMGERPDSWQVLSDDRIAVRHTAEGHAAWGTPWHGEARAAVNESAPLAGVFFLRHGRRHRLVPLDAPAMLRRLFPTVSIPWYDREVFPLLLDACGTLSKSVPAYDLFFSPEIGVLDVLESFG